LRQQATSTARKSEINTYVIKHTIHASERVSEVDLMSMLNPLSFRRRTERQWAERIKLLRRMGGQVVVAAKRKLQSAINHDGLLIPIPVRIVVDPRRRDRSRD
jgi:hypothetical protein